jgi:hypothetical protein
MSARARTALLLSAACLAAGLAGCTSKASTSGAGGLGNVPTTGSTTTTAPAATTGATTPAATPTPTPKPVAAPLTCNQLESAMVGSTTVHYNGYTDGIPLGGLGVWSGEDGATVTLEPPCGIGDLDGDGAKDALGVVSLTTGGTGTFYTLVVWHNKNGKPVCTALLDLGDRNPIQTIAISGKVATVVWLTRTPDAPSAVLNLERTSTFKLSGHTLTETGHVDEPYGG